MSDFSGSAASQAEFIWKNAEDLWGDFKHTDFGKIILPLTLLRRLECALETNRDIVRERYQQLKAQQEKLEQRAREKGEDYDHKTAEKTLDSFLRQASGYPFYNISSFSLGDLGASKTQQNLIAYLQGFSENARNIFDEFDFGNTIARLNRAGLLYKITTNFASIDLHPNTVPDRVMSNIYEHLIRRFGAEVNEAAEDFMTPRDVVHLATELLLAPDNDLFTEHSGLIRTLYDPTCGTGGFLTDAMNHAQNFMGSGIPPTLVPHGQELEPETHAVCVASMLIRQLPSDLSRDLSENIKQGSTLSNDHFANQRFHYGLSNPPFGKKWEKDASAVKEEHERRGYNGRFGAGLPRINDGSMLFLQHLVSKLELPGNGGGRAAIVLSGSPLFNGGAGSGESEIRRYLLENDFIEAIIALPTELFFRTGITTYLWILSNKKPEVRKNRVQLINAADLWQSIKNEGNKRRIIGDDDRLEILNLYADAEDNDKSRILDYRSFGYRRIRVLRPLRLSLIIDELGFNKLQSDKVWKKLPTDHQTAWQQAISAQFGNEYAYAWAENFVKDTAKQSKSDGIALKANKTFITALINAFGHKTPEGEPVRDNKDNLVFDNDLTDYENVPYTQNIKDYFDTEVLPHVPDALIDESFTDEKDGKIGRVGYEINFNRFFYEYQAPRALTEIDADLATVEAEIAQLLNEVSR